MKRTETLWTMFAVAALAAACGGEKKVADEEPSKAPEKAVTLADYRKQQEHFADSVLGTASPASKIVEKLGKGYKVGSPRLRDSIAALASSTDCYAKGRGVDPYLAGSAAFWIQMSVVGTDFIRIQEGEGTKWTSAAGNVVAACLNQAAKQWKLTTAMATPGPYIVQVQFKVDESKADTTAAAPSTKAATPPTATKKKG